MAKAIKCAAVLAVSATSGFSLKAPQNEGELAVESPCLEGWTALNKDTCVKDGLVHRHCKASKDVVKDLDVMFGTKEAFLPCPAPYEKTLIFAGLPFDEAIKKTDEGKYCVTSDLASELMSAYFRAATILGKQYLTDTPEFSDLIVQKAHPFHFGPTMRVVSTDKLHKNIPGGPTRRDEPFRYINEMGLVNDCELDEGGIIQLQALFLGAYRPRNASTYFQKIQDSGLLSLDNMLARYQMAAFRYSKIHITPEAIVSADPPSIIEIEARALLDAEFKATPGAKGEFCELVRVAAHPDTSTEATRSQYSSKMASMINSSKVPEEYRAGVETFIRDMFMADTHISCEHTVRGAEQLYQLFDMGKKIVPGTKTPEQWTAKFVEIRGEDDREVLKEYFQRRGIL